MCELPKKLPPDNLYEPHEESAPVDTEVPAPPDLPERKYKTMCGQALSSFPQYRRIKELKMRRNNFCEAFHQNGHDDDAQEDDERRTLQECVCVQIAGERHT